MSSVGQLVPQVTRPPNMSIKINGPHIEGSFCSLINYSYDPIISIICAMYIVFGIVYTLFGYRCFKASMFLTGFTFGSAIVYLICLQEYLMPPYGNVGVAICAGLLFGLITMLIQYVGLFMTGFHTGLLLAIAGLAIYDHFLEARPNTYWLCVVVLLVSGIFFAVINLYWKKVLTVFGTSVYGGAMIATCLDYFLERMVMLKWVWERAKLEPAVAPPCRLSWLALAAWPAAALVGLVAQAALTAAGTHHEQSISAQKRRLKAQAARPATREQRAEMKQRKYRYLYQVRTAHGDVISQSYVQALQKKAQCNNWSARCRATPRTSPCWRAPTWRTTPTPTTTSTRYAPRTSSDLAARYEKWRKHSQLVYQTQLFRFIQTPVLLRDPLVHCLTLNITTRVSLCECERSNKPTDKRSLLVFF